MAAADLTNPEQPARHWFSVVAETKTKKSLSSQNVLLEIDHRYEDEKAALLASLRDTKDKFEQEKQRQMMLANMRRERKRLQRQEKFASAEHFINVAKDQEKALKET